MPETTLYLFRNDLRLSDNPAFTAACNSDQPVILLFILDDSPKNKWTAGSASRWWLYHSLQSLYEDIKESDGKLYLRRGDTIKILDEIIRQASVNKLYFSRAYEPYQRNIEDQIYAKWNGQIEIKRYGSYLLFEPEQIQTGNNQPYKVFTPFWKSYLKKPEPQLTRTKLKQEINFSSLKIEQGQLDSWGLLPTKPDWATGLRDNWKPGEANAKLILQEFLDNAIAAYESDRNRPDIKGTSCLSPYLHFGEISPVRIWIEVKKYMNKNQAYCKSGMSYLRELGWRDFSNHLLFHWPDLPEAPFRKEFKQFPWKKNKNALLAWQKGQTGYPIVDAGMRQLWYTGWMHNRARMIVASFLVKHLLIYWNEGEDWFWDTLVDADLANNAASWQWIAGSGADAAPYFRIFNPILQGKKFDPEGNYVRRWVPEIAKLETQYIHEPWNTPKQELEQANIRLGQTYPWPIIEHDVARKRALAAYEEIKNSG